MSLSQISESILQALDANGGQFAGTMQLAKTVCVDEHHISRDLDSLRHNGLIKSSHSHGGRGHKSVHRLTKQGYYILTHKGLDHVRSK